jgi:hypothetical protein
MDYGLYVAHAKKPVYIGTAGQCRAQVDLLTDEQKQSGWTIGPIPEEPSPLPIDPGFPMRVFMCAAVISSIAIILLIALYVRGYFR